ncbi:hypothetical protein B1207_05710 [Legionella quinlivanii]|uniref:Uncharacterized protein n=1 Tax=Legionella quinlivanii TaxID=45073 RepID=A0A364LK07_9GAMM|nr:hypothetical protein [Legionella quinlivanii]RAP36928.1 hypothetical protein B1207_05710 [Legionella quinlivanii]
MKDKVLLSGKLQSLAAPRSEEQLRGAILAIHGDNKRFEFAEFEKTRLALFHTLHNIAPLAPVVSDLKQYLKKIKELYALLFNNNASNTKFLQVKPSSSNFLAKKSQSERSFASDIKSLLHPFPSKTKIPILVTQPAKEDLSRLIEIIRTHLLPLLVSPSHLALIQEDEIKKQLQFKEPAADKGKATIHHPCVMMCTILDRLILSLGAYCSNLAPISPRSKPGARRSQEECIPLLFSLLQRLAKFYNSPQSNEFSATINGLEIPARSIPQETAYRLLGIDANGRGQPWIFTNATHFVVRLGEVYFKTDRPVPPLGFGREALIQKIFHSLFPQEAPSFLTPSTLLRLENVFIQKNANGQSEILPPRYIQASSAVEGISLTHWLLIKEITDVLRARHGIDILKKAMYHWITGAYIRETKITELFARLIDNQRNMAPDERILQFKKLPGRDKLESLQSLLSDLPDTIKNLSERLVKDEGEATVIKAYSFILKWPTLTAGRSLDEIVRWVSLLARLPELFLDIDDKALSVLKSNPQELEYKISQIEQQLFGLWNSLDLQSALALAAGSLILGAEDGKADNYQVCLHRDNKGQLINWSIVFIDIGAQMLERGVVAEKSTTTLQGNVNSTIKHRAGIKSILFMIPPIQSAIISKLVFKDTAENLFLEAMVTAREANRVCTNFINQQLYTESGELITDQMIPFRFTAEDLPSIYEGLKTLIHFIKFYPHESFEKFFYFFDPLLATYYSKIYKENCLSPLRAYYQMYTMCMEDIISASETLTNTNPDFANGNEVESNSSSFFTRRRKNSTTTAPRLIKQPSGSKLEANTTHSTPSLIQQSNSSTSPKTLGQLMTSEQSSRIDDPKSLTLDEAFRAVIKLFPWREVMQDRKTLTYWLGMIEKILPEPMNLENIVGNPELAAKIAKEIHKENDVSFSQGPSV